MRRGAPSTSSSTPVSSAASDPALHDGAVSQLGLDQPLAARRQWRGSVSGRSTPGEETSSTYGRWPHRVVVVERLGDGPADLGDVVQAHTAVAVDDHTQQPPLARRVTVTSSKSSPSRFDDRLKELHQAVAG